MNKRIIIREAFDWITEQEVTHYQLKELISYVSKHYPEQLVLEQQFNRVRFINYVGIIYCGGVFYEILPKIALSEDDQRKALFHMLIKTQFLSIRFMDSMDTTLGGSKDLLEAIISSFVQVLEQELKKGIEKRYIRVQESLSVLKGKLVISEHVRQNANQLTRIHCSYEKHHEDYLLNQIFKAALKLAERAINNHRILVKIRHCLGYLADVSDLVLTSKDLERVVFDRQNRRFEDAFRFAKLILHHADIYGKSKKGNSFSFLFPMNELFEQYIGVLIQEMYDFGQVQVQHQEKRLLKNKMTGYRSIQIKPDFVIKDEIILDTKWKNSVFQGKVNYQQSDIYQMYAYVTAYEKAKRCILLYPKQEMEPFYPIWEVIDTDKTIEMHTVRLDTEENTRDDLRNVLAVTN